MPQLPRLADCNWNTKNSLQKTNKERPTMFQPIRISLYQFFNGITSANFCTLCNLMMKYLYLEQGLMETTTAKY